MEKVKYPIHPDFKPLENIPASMFTKGWVRPLMRLYSKINFARAKAPENIETAYYTFKSSDMADIRVELYKPKGANEKLSLIIYFHGGGFIFPPV